MKIGILTYHRAENYGAVLQAYALQQVIQSKGIDCDIIDYRCKGIEDQYKYRTLELNGNLLIDLKYNLNIFLHRKKKKSFSQFRSIMKLSFSYTLKTISTANKHYDGFIVGSDQVWNNKNNCCDNTYLLDFVDKSYKKNSYAASFGIGEIENELESIYTKLLKDFSYISVREQRGAQIVKNLIESTCPVVLDPVFLLNKEKWQSFVKSTSDKYILVYQLYYTKSLLNFAEELSKKTKFKLVTISQSLKTEVYSLFHSKNKSFVSPDEFVSLLANAQYVVTNSYHGTALSIILNKQFFTEFVADSFNVNSRFEELFDIFGLYGRKIINQKNCDIDKKIDYNIINNILKDRQKMSLHYLDQLLRDIERKTVKEF